MQNVENELNPVQALTMTITETAQLLGIDQRVCSGPLSTRA